jgi:hypothetical protein
MLLARTAAHSDIPSVANQQPTTGKCANSLHSRDLFERRKMAGLNGHPTCTPTVDIWAIKGDWLHG